MSDLVKKLNVLLRARLRDVVGEAVSPSKKTSPPNLGKDIDREIEALRQRLNEAFEHEDVLKQQIGALQAEIEVLDREADTALTQGDDDLARRVVTQIQRTRQRMTMLESDLVTHQWAVRELFDKVSLLESVVADARRAVAPTPDPVMAQESASIAESLRQARDDLAAWVEPITPSVTENQVPVSTMPQDNVVATNATPTETESGTGASAVDTDLERRRERLSRR